ncbi:MAG: carboxylesterase [Oleiphilus sp.]|nr:MAG: carboxylesterase [Oleiphilus sp.]
MALLPHITVETGEAPLGSVIWLHGLGASGHDFEAIVPHLALPDELPLRFIFPHAPEIPVTINGGFVMPAWYDILELGLERKIDHAQIRQSSDAIRALIAQEIERGIPSEQILLAGFSQGGAVVYQCGLSYEKPLAGILALSTYFASGDDLRVHPANSAIPVHLFHGTEDDMVPERMGLAACERLKALGLEPEFRHYPIGHEVSLQEIRDLSVVIQGLLGNATGT